MLITKPDNNTETSETKLKNLSEFEREALAENPDTTPSVLALLAKDQTGCIQKYVALNPNTTPDTLLFLAAAKSAGVRGAVAKASKSPEVLELLATDPVEPLANDPPNWVQICVAENRNTPDNALAFLATSASCTVRAAVARNKNTPPHVLDKLAEDDYPEVLSAVAGNENTPEEALDLLTYAACPRTAATAKETKKAVSARNRRSRKFSPEILEILAR